MKWKWKVCFILWCICWYLSISGLMWPRRSFGTIKIWTVFLRLHPIFLKHPWKIGRRISKNLRQTLQCHFWCIIFFNIGCNRRKTVQKYAGVNFKAYLQDIRLRYAWKEVKDSDKTLSEIAMENGFPNSKALARSFQKKYGMLPSEYRKREKWLFTITKSKKLT